MMDQLASLSKPKIAILAAFVYTAIMGIGMFYMKTFLGISYGQPEMMNPEVLNRDIKLYI